MAGAENKRTETFPLGDSSNIHSSCFTHVGHCGCLLFQHFYLLSCPEKNGLDGWQGKSVWCQETSRMWVESPMYWVPAAPRSNCGALDANIYIQLPASTERRLRVKGERLCWVFSYWLLFPTSFSQRFSLCQPRRVLRGTLNLPQ